MPYFNCHPLGHRGKAGVFAGVFATPRCKVTIGFWKQSDLC